MRGDYYVGGFINGKIISGILWYHMHLKEFRALHTLLFGSRVILDHVNWCILALVKFGELLNILECVANIYMCILVVYWWLLSCLINRIQLYHLFSLIMFNCELWTNPSGHLVDHLPYLYGWIDGVQE